MKDDFYIGYSAKAPSTHTKWVKRFLFILIPLLLLLATLITLSQKNAGRGIFNYGNQTELEGILKETPVPHLRVFNDKGIFGENIYKTVILTGANKFGAEKITREIINSQEKGANLDSLYVKMRGTLIYNDGKALFELTDGKDAWVETLTLPDVILNDSLSSDKFLGGFQQYQLETVLQGEIIDPKCYFGAMKPGEGKVHKSCAIRCISGGIPPVLKTTVNNTNEYYILFGTDKKSVNKQVLDFVAEPVEISGRFEALDDWNVLYINGKESIRKL